MALIQNFTVSQNQAGTVLYLADSTGDYDAGDNTGGYGAPNTARNLLALIALAKYKASTGDVDLTVDSYDPESVTQWTISDNDSDGHVEIKVYSIAKKTGSETPVTNDFVYDFSGNQLQRWNGSSWVSATYSELEDNDITHTTIDYPVLSAVWVAFNNCNKLYISGSSTMSRNDLKAAISDTSAILNGTIALFAEGSFATAQKNIERYQSRVDTLTALTE